MTENGDRPELPDGWALSKLADLGTWVGGGTPSKQRAEFWEGGTVPWVSPKDMKSWRLEGTQDAITPDAVAGSAARLFPADSVAVVVRSGILEHTLPVALVPFEATANQDMRVVSPREEVDARWLLYALLGRAEHIRRTCSKHGTTVASIEVPQMMDYELPLPPKGAQLQLVETIEANLTRIDDGLEALRKAGVWAARLRGAVLGAATGAGEQ